MINEKPLKYGWKNGAAIKNKALGDPNSIQERLQVIRQESGQIRSQAVVDAARPEGDILHPHFEWEDQIAAEEYRKSQAVDLVGAIVVIREVESEKETRAYVCIKERGQEEKSYVPIMEALSDKDYRDQVITQALREAESWRERYEKYAELAAICNAITEVKATLEPKKKKVEA
jgi:hypothetical protein